jgi:hypothetical protein
MKILRFIPLLFLTACSTTPKLTLRPQQPPPAADNSAVRYPEVVHGYHFARYVDPNDDLVTSLTFFQMTGGSKPRAPAHSRPGERKNRDSGGSWREPLARFLMSPQTLGLVPDQ